MPANISKLLPNTNKPESQQRQADGVKAEKQVSQLPLNLARPKEMLSWREKEFVQEPAGDLESDSEELFETTISVRCGDGHHR